MVTLISIIVGIILLRGAIFWLYRRKRTGPVVDRHPADDPEDLFPARYYQSPDEVYYGPSAERRRSNRREEDGSLLGLGVLGALAASPAEARESPSPGPSSKDSMGSGGFETEVDLAVRISAQETPMEAPTEDIEHYLASIRILVQTLREEMVSDPSREGIEQSLGLTVARWAQITVKGDEKERVLGGPVYALIVTSYLDVVFNNPLYNSHALVMQWDVAVQRRIKEYGKLLKEKKHAER